MLLAHASLIALLVLAGQRVAPRVAQDPAASEVNALAKVLLGEFQKRNRAIARANVTELRQMSRANYVVLAWGTTGVRSFQVNFEDELHGVFVVDHAFSRVERVLEIRPTPRWSDYRFWIDKLTEDEVVVRGEGATYRDGALRQAYTLNDDAVARIAAAKKVVRLAPSAFRALPMAVRKRLEADGCQVPQSPGLKSPHNVVSGHFATAGQLDWAVLCSVDGDSSIRIFWGGLATCPDHDLLFRDSSALDLDTLRWRVTIRKASPAQVAATARELDLSLMNPIHEGVEGQYCQEGKWLDLEPIP